ncbi:MAG: VTC domain-containing protein [Planctomycetes bacterium]|nr:VTC domain-containing protein [Planctomycetota bacterium]
MEKAVNNYRYERKFFISELTRQEIESLIKLHPALFSEIYPPRYVNNIYFDSFDMKNYFDNIDGAADRVKVRIRWYGDLFGLTEKPMLELKIKRALLGTKKFYPLKPFNLDGDFGFETLVQVFKDSAIPEALRLQLILLKPVLLNRYSRWYYRSADSDYRLTVDSDMEFYEINVHSNTYLHRHKDHNHLVLELKYEQNKDHGAHNIAGFFPFRMTKNSKYLNGIESLAV